MQKKFLYILLLAFLIFSLSACVNKERKDDDKNQTDSITVITEEQPIISMTDTVDWQGTYKGVLPCADCEGIQTFITLNNDSTYHRVSNYINMGNSYTDSGIIVFDENILKLIDSNEVDSPILCEVTDSTLTILDNEGIIIEGELADQYILRK